MGLTVQDLLPDPTNPRRIAEEALGGLQASLRAFGDVSGIVWNRRTGELVGGHQRLRALKAEASRRRVELRVFEGQDYAAIILPSGGGMGEQRYRLTIVDMSRAEQIAANLSANNPAIGGEFTEAAQELLDQTRQAFPELYEETRLAAVADLARGAAEPEQDEWAAALGSLPTGERGNIRQMTFTLTVEQADVVRDALEAAKRAGPFIDTGNENSNGNALARICEAYRG